MLNTNFEIHKNVRHKKQFNFDQQFVKSELIKPSAINSNDLASINFKPIAEYSSSVWISPDIIL